MVPFALLPNCHNTGLVKLPVFAVLSGILLALAAFVPGKRISTGELVLLILMTLFSFADMRTLSNPGLTRVTLVFSGCSVFLALRILNLEAERIILPVIAGGIFALTASFLTGSDQARLAGYFGNANLLGSFSAALIPVGTAYLTRLRGKAGLLAVPFALLCGYALFSSGTRSSLAALALGVTTAALLRWKTWLLPVLSVLFTAAVLFTAYSPEMPALSGRAETLQVRRVIWGGSWRMFTEKPLFGWGTGSFQREFPAFRDPGFEEYGVSANTVHAHSEPLEILAENGIAGFLLFGGAIYMLLLFSLKKKLSRLHWGVIASILVLLIEGLASVALRWTVSFSILVLFMSAIPGLEQGKAKGRIFSSIVFFSAMLLCVFGGIAGYRMTMASSLLGRALSAAENGESPDLIRTYCEEALNYNRFQPGAWYTMGNAWGLQAGTEQGSERLSSLTRQVAAYDSLERLAPDFAWMRVNRIDALIGLGEYNRAMDDIIHAYRTRAGLQDRMRLLGYILAPTASPGKILILMNLELCEVIRDEAAVPAENLRQSRARNSLLAVYAVAGVLCPDTVKILETQRDSILTPCGGELLAEIRNETMNELAVCLQGESLLSQCPGIPFEDVETAAEAAFETAAAAPWHRAALLQASYSYGDTDRIAEFHSFVSVMCEPCIGMISIFPGSSFNLSSAASLQASSADAFQTEVMSDCILFSCRIDASGWYTFTTTGRAPDYWVRNEGPFARSNGFTSENSISDVIEGFTGLNDNNAEYRIVKILALSAMEMCCPGADGEVILQHSSAELGELRQELIAIHGEGEGSRLFLGIARGVVDSLREGPIPPEASDFAEMILSASM